MTSRALKSQKVDRGHLSSDGSRMPGAPRRACGCQSCRHRFGAPKTSDVEIYDRARNEILDAVSEALEPLTGKQRIELREDISETLALQNEEEGWK